MLCRKPYVKAGVPYPCGQCMPCRYNRRRMWAGRMMLENLCHGDSAFVTLTYSNEKLPLDDMKPILVKKHLQDFLKRFRERVAPLKVRFYAVGEYSDDIVSGDTVVKWGRPNYHIIMYGYPTCLRGLTKRDPVTSRSLWSDCCPVCKLYGDAWGFGDILLGSVTRDSANYCAEYTVKKWTKVGAVGLRGRPPEFCTMSLRPGIGANAMWDVASSLLHYDLDEKLIDVPEGLDQAKRKLPLGRYLRDKLRVMIGKEKGASEKAKEVMAEELRPLYEDWFASTEGKAYGEVTSFGAYLSALDDQKFLNIEARNAIYKKERRL